MRRNAKYCSIQCVTDSRHAAQQKELEQLRDPISVSDDKLNAATYALVILMGLSVFMLYQMTTFFQEIISIFSDIAKNS